MQARSGSGARYKSFTTDDFALIAGLNAGPVSHERIRQYDLEATIQWYLNNGFLVRENQSYQFSEDGLEFARQFDGFKNDNHCLPWRMSLETSSEGNELEHLEDIEALLLKHLSNLIPATQLKDQLGLDANNMSTALEGLYNAGFLKGENDSLLTTCQGEFALSKCIPPAFHLRTVDRPPSAGTTDNQHDVTTPVTSTHSPTNENPVVSHQRPIPVQGGSSRTSAPNTRMNTSSARRRTRDQSNLQQTVSHDNIRASQHGENVSTSDIDSTSVSAREQHGSGPGADRLGDDVFEPGDSVPGVMEGSPGVMEGSPLPRNTESENLSTSDIDLTSVAAREQHESRPGADNPGDDVFEPGDSVRGIMEGSPLPNNTESAADDVTPGNPVTYGLSNNVDDSNTIGNTDGSDTNANGNLGTSSVSSEVNTEGGSTPHPNLEIELTEGNRNQNETTARGHPARFGAPPAESNSGGTLQDSLNLGFDSNLSSVEGAPAQDDDDDSTGIGGDDLDADYGADMGGGGSEAGNHSEANEYDTQGTTSANERAVQIVPLEEQHDSSSPIASPGTGGFNQTRPLLEIDESIYEAPAFIPARSILEMLSQSAGNQESQTEDLRKHIWSFLDERQASFPTPAYLQFEVPERGTKRKYVMNSRYLTTAEKKGRHEFGQKINVMRKWTYIMMARSVIDIIYHDTRMLLEPYPNLMQHFTDSNDASRLPRNVPLCEYSLATESRMQEMTDCAIVAYNAYLSYNAQVSALQASH